MHDRVVRFADEHGLARVGNCDAHCPRRDRDGLHHVPGPRRRRRCARDRGPDDPPARQLPRDGRPARARSASSSGSTAATPGRASAGGSAATGRAGTSATRRRASSRATARPSWPSAGSGARRGRGRGRRRMKIGLVTPYVYPLPGGVNQHVRYLYENLRLRGPRRPDHHQLATASSAPPRATSSGSARASRCRPTARSARSRSRRATCRRSTRCSSAEQFDLLHFHEPFVPFLSLDRPRDCRTSVNIATFHAYGGFSPALPDRVARLMRPSAAGLHGRIAVSRGGAPLRRPLLPGRLQGHPERRRRRPLPAGRARSRAGRTAPGTSCSSAGSSHARACSTCSRRTGSCARPAATAGSWWSAAGRRSARRAGTS